MDTKKMVVTESYEMVPSLAIVTMTDGIEVTAKASTLGELADRLTALAERLRAACVPVAQVTPDEAPGEAAINASDPSGLRATR